MTANLQTEPRQPSATPGLAPEPFSVGMADAGLVGLPFWFCVRTHPKHEHIAAAHLRRLGITQTFCPRIRHQQPTRRGPVWMVEAVFPCYLFTRFALLADLHTVTGAPCVKHLVRFGDRWPIVPAAQITELQAALRGEEVVELPPRFEPGDEVQIATGPFLGLSAVVQRYLPAKERVRVLLEFLGRTTAAELGADQLQPVRKHPPELARDAEPAWLEDDG